MPIKNQPTSPKKAVWEKPMPSYASKPAAIGVVIKRIAEEKGIASAELERRIGFDHRNVYRLFKAKTLSIKMMFTVSEALEENLLLMFQPNVKPLPNPLLAELDKLKAENEQLKAQLKDLAPLTDENKVLKGQLEVLKEVMKGK